MTLTVWLIAQEGMDRVLVQTTEPTSFQKGSRPCRIWRADIEIPDVVVVDGSVRVEARQEHPAVDHDELEG